MRQVQGLKTHLVDPVGVEHTEAAQLSASALLGKDTQIPGGLELCDSLPHRLTVHDTLQACARLSSLMQHAAPDLSRGTLEHSCCTYDIQAAPVSS